MMRDRVRQVLLRFSAAALAAASTPATASGQSPLAGVQKVAVQVHLYGAYGDTLDPPLSIDRVRTALELRLRTVGLTVLSDSEVRVGLHLDPVVVLSLYVYSLPKVGSESWYMSFMELAMLEWQKSARNGAWAFLLLDKRNFTTMARGGELTRNVQEAAEEMANAMLNEWLKANPRR